MKPTNLVARPERRFLFLFLVIFLVASFALAPGLFLHPRFWAEEGTIYFAQLRGHGFFDALSFVFNSNYQFATNLFAYLATLVPLEYAPAVTSYLSLLVELVVALQIAVFCEQNRIPRYITTLIVIAWAASPTNVEIFMTATNVQWT